MKLLDTLSQKKIKLEKNKEIKMFVCGPTVYDYSHLGHARTYLAFDLLIKYLRHLGYKIFYLQNITNIDDKIINKAREEKKDPFKIAKYFENEYYNDIKKLKINSVNQYAKATDFIKEIINQINTLIEKKYAYKIEGEGYYFNIKKFKSYGKLSKRFINKTDFSFSRIDESIKKKNKGDFCLWKFVNVNEPSFKNYQVKIFNYEPAWDTPLGWGRPGWHIEDTAISEKYFGVQYDIHGGAYDLIFPHHEAEIAQQEAASGKKPFVKIWLHTGFLTIEGKKMSKSLKNFITIKDFLKNNPPEILRWLIFNFHYRSPINYTPQLLQQTKNSFENILELILKLNLIIKKSKNSFFKFDENYLQKIKKEIDKNLQDDFNTPKSLAIIFDFIKEINLNLFKLSKTEAKLIKKFIIQFFEIFDINLKIEKIPKKILILNEKREQLRNNKQFIQADDLRNKINKLGYKIEDTPFGSIIIKKYD